MISRDKMFIVASNLDDSIKAQTVVYDVTLFKTFVDLESYVNATPCVLNTIIINEADLPFTNVNMSRLLEMLASPFLRLEGNVVYLIGNATDKESIMEFIDTNEIVNWKVYQGDLTPRFITGIVSGEGRDSEVTETEVYTYRMRTEEYIRYKQEQQFEDNSGHYPSDEELLAGIPDVEVPEVFTPTVDFRKRVYYVVGEQIVERTLFAYVLAQYLSLNEKTIIVESDTQFHTLSDMATKSGVKCKFIRIEDLYKDSSSTIKEIRETLHKLIVVTVSDRVRYDYDFVVNLLMSCTEGFITNYVKECSYDDVPYGRNYTIVCRNTVPEIIKCCNQLNFDVSPMNTMFVGLQIGDLGPVCVTSAEMESIVNTILGKNDLVAQVVKSNGVRLKGDGIIYDVLSLVGRGNEG